MVEKNASSNGTIDGEAYMSRDQLRYFQEKLLRWRKELWAKVQERQDEDDFHGLSDWLDFASHNTQVELSLADRERSLHLIRQIDAALGRIESGTYGYCAESGEEIGIKRLMVVPIALYSVEIQNEIERRRQTNRYMSAAENTGAIYRPSNQMRRKT